MDQARSRGWSIIRAAIAGTLAAGTLIGVAHGQGQETVYVVNVASNDVSVIDPSAGAVVATIPVGRQPSGIAVSPDGRTIYVSNLQDDTVSVIDAPGQAVVATIGVGDEPVGIAVAPDGSRAYVTNRRSNSVSVVDTAANAVVATIADGVGPGSNGIALTPDGGFAYVNNASSKNPGTLSVIDTALDQTVASVEVARNPKRVAIAPDGLTAYVANFRSWNISVVDIPTNTFTTGLRVSGRTVGVAVHPNGQYAYITNLDGTVEILETSNDLVTVPIAVGHEPYAIALSRQGGTAYVANLGDDTVSVVDLAADVETDVIPVGDKPFALAVGCMGEGCDLPPFTPKPTRTATPSPTITLTPTITSTGLPTDTVTPNPNAAELRIGATSGHPGETIDVPVRLDPHGSRLAGAEITIDYAPPLTVVRDSEGVPDCTADPGIRQQVFGAFQPPGCAGEACSGAHLLVLSLTSTVPFPGAVTLFTCRVAIAADAVPGEFSLEVSLAATGTPEGGAYDTIGIGATITVLAADGPTAGAVRLDARSGLCSGGAYADRECANDADCLSGVCAQPSSICDGGPDDGLLCDCPGGSCEAEGGCGGDASRGTCRGGRTEGVCCDTDFACAGNRPCAPSALVCAGGVAKGLPCLNDHHCPGSSCYSPASVCRGGQFDRFACIDDFDCPGGSCSTPPTPIPTRTSVVPKETRTARPTATPAGAVELTATARSMRTREPTSVPGTTTGSGTTNDSTSSSGGGGGCAVVPTRGSGYEWLMLLALIAARYGRRRP